jgi:5S rRNA maturation endonuclease (ribonuclease M5)
MNNGLPPELSRHFGSLPDIKQRGKDHWTSACPVCGGSGGGRSDVSDRFCMWLNPARFWCRQCGHQGFVSQLDGHTPSQEEIDRAHKLYIAHLEKENKELRRKVAALQKADFWKRWHDEMTEAAKKLWYRAGIDDALIEIHQLGYTSERYESCDGALTIPYLHDDRISTLQYRLINPPDAGDKYRFEQGTRVQWFRPWPYGEPDKVILVVEGAKKGLVAWRQIATLDQFTYQGEEITILASPQKHIPKALLEQLHKAERVILLLDPDAYAKEKGQMESALLRNARMIGPDKVRHVRTTAKIDDMLLQHGLTGKTLMNMVGQASPIIFPGTKLTKVQKYL